MRLALVSSFEKMQAVHIPATLAAGLRQLSRDHGVSLFMF